MTTLEIWLLAISLAMDCFSVSITSGIILRRICWRTFITIAFFFGLFQGLMPLFGWLAASYFSHLIENYDYWGVKEFFPDMDETNGVSLILLNTETGVQIFDNVKDVCEVRQSTVADGTKYNGNLVTHSLLPSVRLFVFSQITRDGYKKVAETVFKVKNYRLLSIKIKVLEIPIFRKLRKWIKR